MKKKKKKLQCIFNAIKKSSNFVKQQVAYGEREREREKRERERERERWKVEVKVKNKYDQYEEH